MQMNTMKHRSTRDVVDDLRQGNRLIEVTDPIDPNLEMAEIQRRIYANGGPAILFTNVTGCRFPMASNLFASLEQARYLFRDTLETVRRLIEVKIDPSALPKNPFRYLGTPLTVIRMLPRFTRSAAVSHSTCSLMDLPQLKCWPDDGGAFVTLPQVLSTDPAAPSNLMRVNMACIAFRFPATIMIRKTRWAFIIRSIEAWASITVRRLIKTRNYKSP